MVGLKTICKSMYEPLEQPISPQGVAVFVAEVNKSRKFAFQCANYLYKKVTNSAFYAVRLKVSYLLLQLISQFSDQLGNFFLEFEKLAFQQLCQGPDFHLHAPANLFAFYLLSKQPDNALRTEEQIKLNSKTFRSLIGYIAGFSTVVTKVPELNVQDIINGATQLAFKKLGQTMSLIIKAQQEGANILKFKPDVADLSLCANQLEDYAGGIGKTPQEIKLSIQELQGLFQTVQKQQRLQ